MKSKSKSSKYDRYSFSPTNELFATSSDNEDYERRFRASKSSSHSKRRKVQEEYESDNYRNEDRHRSQRSRRRSRGSPRDPHKEKPKDSRCLGVFGMWEHTKEDKILDIFSKYGKIRKIAIVMDAKSGRSRGFCFVYFDQLSDAKIAKDYCNGLEIDGKRVRVDFSVTQRAHTPTPGVYRGRITRAREEYMRSTYRRRVHSSSRYSPESKRRRHER